ncbi:MAG: hypothetical protein ACKVU4_11755 [Phycisphaerales bacterium]
MSRTLILFIAMGAVLIGGAAVALLWWSLADKFFPGAARSTGQGLRPSQRKEPPAKAVVVREFEGDPAANGPPTQDSPASAPPPDRGPR